MDLCEKAYGNLVLLSLLVVLLVPWQAAYAVGGGGDAGGANLAGFYRNDGGMILNVTDKNGNPRLLKVVVLVKLKTPETDQAKIAGMWPELVQETMFLVGDYRMESLYSFETKENLRQKILALFKQLVKKAHGDGDIVQDILYEEFVFQ